MGIWLRKQLWLIVHPSGRTGWEAGARVYPKLAVSLAEPEWGQGATAF